MLLGVLHHAIHFVVGQGRGAGDGDLLLLAGAEILSGHVHDAVGVDVEGNLDLRHATTGSRNAGQLETAQRLVARGHLALALQDVHLDGGLVVGRCGVDFGLAGRNGGVALDHLGHHAAHGFNAEGQRGDVEQQDALHVAGEHAALNSGAHGHDLVRVHGHVRGLAGQLLHELLHGRHTGGAADENDLVNFAHLQASVLQRLLHRLLAAVEQILGDTLELGAGQRVVKMLRAGGVGGDEGQVDVGLRGGGQLHLRLLGRFLQTLQGHGVLTQIDAVLGLELVGHPVDDALIPVVAAQVVVASGGGHLEHAVAELQHGHVEGAAAQVEDEDLLVMVDLVEAVSQSRSRRLVDDAQDLQTGDLTGVLGGLTLSVVKVSRHGDDSLGDGLAHLLLRIGLQLLKHHGGNLLGGVILAVDVDDRAAVLALLNLVADGLLLFGSLVVGAADEALHGRDGVLRIGDRLVLRGLADDALAVLAEALHRRGGAIALGVHQNFGLGALHDGHGGVRRAQVDAKNLSHCVLPRFHSFTYR